MSKSPATPRRTSAKAADDAATTTDKPATAADAAEQPVTPPAGETKAADAKTDAAASNLNASASNTTTDQATAESDSPTADDPAEAYRRRREHDFEQMKVTQHSLDTGSRPTVLSDAQFAAQSGISPHSVGGPDLMVEGYAAGQTMRSVRGDYMVAPDDGYIAVRPDGCQQLSTKRVWVKGLQVRRDYYEQMKGHVSSTPETARLYEPKKPTDATADAGATA